jgi:hypothetical protein
MLAAIEVLGRQDFAAAALAGAITLTSDPLRRVI